MIVTNNGGIQWGDNEGNREGRRFGRSGLDPMLIGVVEGNFLAVRTGLLVTEVGVVDLATSVFEVDLEKTVGLVVNLKMVTLVGFVVVFSDCMVMISPGRTFSVGVGMVEVAVGWMEGRWWMF